MILDIPGVSIAEAEQGESAKSPFHSRQTVAAAVRGQIMSYAPALLFEGEPVLLGTNALCSPMTASWLTCSRTLGGGSLDRLSKPRQTRPVR